MDFLITLQYNQNKNQWEYMFFLVNMNWFLKTYDRRLPYLILVFIARKTDKIMYKVWENDI